MRYFRYHEPRYPENDDWTRVTITVSEQQILDGYWDRWYTIMCEKFGKNVIDREYSKNHCLKDWCTLHRAWEVEDHQGETE